MANFTLRKESTGLLVIDVQDRLFRLVERSCEVMQTLQKVIKGFQVLDLPIVVTERYPEGLGPTVGTLKTVLGPEQTYFSKTSFSCMGESSLKEYILDQPIEQWVLTGIEAHVCVLQTAKDLLAAGKDVVILNDAITSRSIYDFSTAIAELRDCGARISTAETVMFELLRDSKSPEFKAMSELIK